MSLDGCSSIFNFPEFSLGQEHDVQENHRHMVDSQQKYSYLYYYANTVSTCVT